MKRHLTRFALALSLPLIVLAGIFLAVLVRQEREHLDEQALEVTQSLTALVEREINGLINVARIISASGILQSSAPVRGLKNLSDMAHALKVHIALYDHAGNIVFLSDLESKHEVPHLTKSDIEAAATAKSAYLTSVRQANKTDPYYFDIVLPVRVEDKTQYWLALSMEAEHISKLLRTSVIDENWLALVVDQNNRILARSDQEQDYTGQLIADELLSKMQAAYGSWSGRILDGRQFFGYYTSPVGSGWRVVAGVNQSESDHPIWFAIGYFTVLLGGALCLSAFLAGYFGRKIAVPVKKLAEQAQRVGDSVPVIPMHSGIHELDVVSDALVEAGQRNRLKEQKLTEAQLRLQMALDVGNIGVWEYDPETETAMIDVRTSQMLTYQEIHQVYYLHDFLPMIVEEDRPLVVKGLEKALRTGEVVREIYRVRDNEQGSTIWVSSMARAIKQESGKVSLLGLIVNVTAEQKAQVQREVVAHELSHRLKNMFAVITSLMNLTAHGKTDVQDYVRQMRERIAALANAFELSYQKGSFESGQDKFVSLNALLQRLSDPYTFGEDGRIFIEGDALRCPLSHVTPISLVFHELVTNSIKHGALSLPTGHVIIRLSLHASFMQMQWIEKGGPEITGEPVQRGFGTRLKELSIDVQMQGSFREIWSKEGLICIIQMPLPDLPDDEIVEDQA